MAIITNSIKGRFVKDYSLPITIFQNDIFMYFIALYDDFFNTKEKYRLLVETVDTLGDEEKFMTEFNLIKDIIIEEITNKKEYKTLATNQFDINIKYYRL